MGDVYVDGLADPDNPMFSIADLHNGVPVDASIPVIVMPALAITDGKTYYFALTAFNVQCKTIEF